MCGFFKGGVRLPPPTELRQQRTSRKKSYMLPARDLAIFWGDTPSYWNWIAMPDSSQDSRCCLRKTMKTDDVHGYLVYHAHYIHVVLNSLFSDIPSVIQFQIKFLEVAKLCKVCWLEICGEINIFALSPNTQYAAYLVFKMIDARGFHDCTVKLSVNVNGGHSSTKNVCLDPSVESTEPNTVVVGLRRPSVRSDGWLEIEIGEFFNSGEEDEEVQMNIKEIDDYNWKSGLFVEGIEVRPK